MISLRALVTTLPSGARVYRGDCGTAGAPDGEPGEARPGCSDPGSCLARAILTHATSRTAAMTTVTHSLRAGAGVRPTGITKPRIIPASRPPRCAALNERAWIQSGKNPSRMKNASSSTTPQRRTIVADPTRSSEDAVQSAPTRPKATPLAPNP